jgi:hypothetical protein
MCKKDQEQETMLMYDPPSGHMYGFPKKVPLSVTKDEETFKKFLLESGYPEEDLDFALRFGRWIG